MKPRSIFSAARLSFPFASALVALLAMPSAHAATLTWDNGAATGNWNTTDLNWTGSAWNNGTPDDAIFDAAGVGTVTLTEAISAGSLTINTAGYTITGNTITLSGGATALTSNATSAINSNVTIATTAGTITSSAGTLTLGGTLDAGSLGLTFAGAGDTTLSSAITNGTTLTKSGAGMLTLAGTNGFTSATINGGTITGGTLTLSSGATALTSSATSAVNSNVTIATSPATITSSAGTLTLGGTLDAGSLGLTFAGAGNTTLSNAITNGATLTKSDAGVLTLAGTNGFTSATINGGTITGGTLTLSSGATALTSSATSAVNSNVTIATSPATITSSAGTLTLGGTLDAGSLGLTFAGAGNTTLSNAIANGATLTKSDAGVLTLTSSNTFTAATINGGTITGGTLTLSSGATALTSSATSAINSNVTLSTAAGTITSSAGTLTLGGTLDAGSLSLTFAGAGNTTLSNAIANGTTLTKSGAGALTSSALNTFTGPITIDGGTLEFSNNTAGARNVYLSTQININNGSTLRISGTAGNIAIYDGRNYTFDSIGGGSILVGTGNYNAGSTAFSITTNGGARNTIGLISTSGAFGFNLGTGSGVTFNVALGSDATSDLTVTPIIANTGSILKTGAGRLTFTGVNTYSGTTTISAGTLNANSSAALGSGVAANTLIFTGGTLQAGGTITSPSTRLVTLTSTGLIDTNSNAVSIAGIASGAGGLTKSGAGTLTLSGANTYTGSTTITAGTLSVGAANNLGAAAANLVFDGGTLQVTGTTLTSLTGLGRTNAVVFNATKAVGFDIVDVNNNFTVGQVLNQTTGGLTKLGAGTLTLNQANTYSGGTTLAAGTVVISNATSFGASTGAVTVTGTSRINATGGITYANDINVGTQTLTMQNPNLTTSTATFSGVLSGSGTISLPNSGTNAVQGIIAFTNPLNTFTGNVNLSASSSGDEFFSFNSLGDGGTLSFAKNGNRQGMIYTGSSNIQFDTRTITVAASMINGNIADRQGMDGSATGPVSSFAVNGAGTVTFTQNMVIGAMAAGNYGVLGLSGSNTGNNTISGIIADPSGAAKLSIGKFDDGKWILSGANTYEAMAMIARGTLEVPTITTAASAQPLGINQAFQLGRGGDSGTLSFTGGTSSTDKQVFIGSPINAATGTGGGSILNNGTGALTFTNPTFNPLSTSYVSPSTGLVAGQAPTVSRTLTLGGTYAGGANTIQGVIQNNAATGAVALTKADAGTWSLTGANTYSGATTIGAGTLNANASIALGNSSATNTLIFTGGTLQAGGAITSLSTRGVTLTSPGLFDTNGNTIAIAGVMSGAGGVIKSGLGALTLSGNNGYTGNTTISAGTIVAQNANALGTGVTRNVSVAPGAGLNYAAAANANLSITGTLGLTGGAGTVIGGSIGSTATGAQIAVTGDATATGAIGVNVYGIIGVTPLAGTNIYTLVNGAGGGSSMNGGTYSLGTVFNNTNFTVGALSTTTSNLNVSITSATALTTAYWTGGLTGATNVWAASDGSANSNWVTSAGGGATPLVPGVGADVFISATSVTTAPTATVLGANMSIKSLTLADTTNGLGLVDDGNTLTITPLSSAVGITMNASVPASTIAARVALGAAQTWTNSSANNLTVSGAISGGFALTKAGTGNLVLSGINTYSGGTTISGGTLTLTGSNNNLSDTGAVNITSATGILNISAKTIASETIGSLAGVAGSSVVLGSNNLTAGGDNTSTVFDGVISGASGSFTKAGSGTMTLGGINTYNGATTLSGGTLRLTNTSAIATSPVLNMAASTTLELRSNTAATFTNTRLNPGIGTTTINADRISSGTGQTLTLGGTVVYANSGTSTLNFTGANGFGVAIGGMYFSTSSGSQTFTLNPSVNTTIAAIRVNTSTSNPDGWGSTTSNQNVGLTLGGAAGTFNTIASITEISGASQQLIFTKSTAASWTVGNITTAQGNGHTMTAGTLTLNGTFTFAQAADRRFTVSGGVLNYNNAAAIATNAATTSGNGFVLTGGSLDNTSGAAITANNNPRMTWGGNWAFIGTNGANSNLNLGTGVVFLTANSQVSVTNPATTLTVGGAVSGAFTLTKAGAGTLTLTGANSHTGGTNVNGGTLLWSGANSLPATGVLAVNAGGTFSLADGTARTTTGATGVGLTLATGSNLVFDWNGASRDTLAIAGTATSNGTVGITINNTSPTGAGGNLITATGASTLSTANYFLANNINFTATLSKTTTTVSIGAQTAATPLTLLFWQGNKVLGTSTAGVDNALGLSTGAVSNWSTAVGAYTATGLVPGSTADVIFSTTAAPVQQGTVLGTNMTVNSVTFNDATTTTIGGSHALTLLSTATAAGTGIAGGGSAITVTSAAANPTISSGIVLGANQTWNVASGKTLTVSGIVSGTSSLTKADTGILLLSAANTYTGITNINAGTLRIGNGTSLGTQTGATDRTVIASGATLDLGGVALGANNEFITASGTGVGGNGAITSSSAIASPFIGVRFLTLAADTTLGFTNRWDVGNNATGGTLTGGGFTLNLVGSGTGQASFNGLGETDLGDININLGNAGTAIVYLQGNTTLGQPAKTVAISGGTTLEFFSNVTLTSYDKKFALNTGNITIGKTGGLALPGTISLTGTNIITANAAAVAITASGVISGAGNLTKAGAGILTLTNANTYNGATTISAGAMVLSGSGALGTAAAGTTVASATSLGLSGAGSFGIGETLTISGTGVTAASLFFSGSATQRGALQSTSGSNTYAGNVELGANGTTRIGTQDGARLTITGNITQASGVTTADILFRPGDTAGDFVTLSGTGNSFGADSTVFTNVTTGNWAGVRLGVSNALPTNLTISGFSGTGAGTALDLNGKDQTLNGLKTGTTGMSIINMDTVTASKLTLNPTTNLITTNTLIVGGAGLGVINIEKIGSFTQTLSGANTYTGTTSVTGGILKAGVASVANVSGAFGNNSAVSLANTAGVSLDITGFNTQIGSLTGGSATDGNVTLGAATLTIAGSNASPTDYAGVISGTDGALTKIGSGTQILSGANTYTGVTTVNAGKLLINGSVSTTSVTTVAIGATLGGSGSMGAVTINGILAPGNSIGTLTAAGDVTWNDNDSWAFELGLSAADLTLADTTGTRDLLNITGAGNDFLKGTGSSFTFDFGGTGAVGYYKLVDWDGSATTNFIAGDFGASNLTSGLTGSFTVDGTTSALYLNVIPEPSTALLSVLGVMMLLRRRR